MTTDKISDMTSDITSTMIFHMTFDTKSDMTKQNYNIQVIVLLFFNLASFFWCAFVLYWMFFVCKIYISINS